MASPQIAGVQVQISGDERDAVNRVLASGQLVQGAEVAAFEDEFAQMVDNRPCVAVNSGTSALHLGLLAAGIGPGDEVIVPSFTFAATANAVAMSGAKPVFVDIDAASFCLDPKATLAAVTSRTAAILPVHLYGHPADMRSLNEVASRHGLMVFEDACQAHMATLDGQPAGALGRFAAFSFYATKNMTTGEGGMVVCEDDEQARKVRLLRNQGMEQKYRNEVVGLNCRMTDMAAAIGRVQLGRLGAWTEARRANAKSFDTYLRGVVTPDVSPGVGHAYHQYTIRTSSRDELLAHLVAHGVGAAVYYPTPTHRLPAFAKTLDLPQTERACAEVISLPVHPAITSNQLDFIVATVNDWSS